MGFLGCATSELNLLTSPTGSGQCGSWANLLTNALKTNGITSSIYKVSSKDGTALLVKNWNPGTQSGPPDSSHPDYLWELILNPSAIAAGDLMVPKQPNNIYGDLTSLSTAPGQNTSPPSEKLFAQHFIVKVTLTGISPSYYDPSYGLSYSDENNFESTALWGYVVGSTANNIFWVRSAAGQSNINFSLP